jgi:hypothetical protein
MLNIRNITISSKFVADGNGFFWRFFRMVDFLYVSKSSHFEQHRKPKHKYLFITSDK